MFNSDIVQSIEPYTMSDKRPSARDESRQRDERSALQAFEQILEAMPDDRGTLEAAILAAQACGELDTALKHRLHLADILRRSGDAVALREQVEILRGDLDPRAQEWLAAFDAGSDGSAAFAEAMAGGEEPPKPSVSVPSAFNISDEIDLAWKLFERQEINQEEYAKLVRDLTEMAASNNRGTVSVLHALGAAHHKGLDRILLYLSQASEEAPTPYVSLGGFTMRPELARILPEEFIVNRGAIVFELMGREWLVALLNPLNPSLRRDIQALCGHPCHFYLTQAADFDNALARLRKVASDSENRV